MVNIFWFRRDLRLNDNHGLFAALKAGLPVELLFIFDVEILKKLENIKDARVTFIYRQLRAINDQLKPLGSSIRVEHGKPAEVFESMLAQQKVHTVFANEDYEPYALMRDEKVEGLLKGHGANFLRYKDHVIFSPGEVLKEKGTPYTMYTPFANKWKRTQAGRLPQYYPSENYLHHLQIQVQDFPELQSIGFQPSEIEVPEMRIQPEIIKNYANTRNFPAIPGTTMAGPHLRFGTFSIRQAIKIAQIHSETWLNELIWREFFIHVLYFFPNSASNNFNPRYNNIQWRNNEAEFQRWCEGRTGYAMVDAGMRELTATGTMHNRVRMVAASFLTKHLLIDWRWGEAFFASHLLDFELSSNVGNWQWAAGTGCDAAPYFRVFNPTEQLKKFDDKLKYTRKWVPEMDETHYKPMVDHAMARIRAIKTYIAALG